MKKILAVLFCSLIVTLTGCVNNPLKVDPAATAKAPWKVGEKIFGKGNCERGKYYREFLGITKTGLALMQDFYLNGKKRTDPFLMTLMNAGNMKEGDCQLNVEEGLYIYWYENGQKGIELTFSNGKVKGPMTKWYDNGQIKSLANMKNGKPDGSLTTWYKNGQKQLEGNFKNEKKVGIWRVWDEQGNQVIEKDYDTPED